MSDFDFAFERAFLGGRQATILHKYCVSHNVWHVVTVDCNGYYRSAYWRMDSEMHFEFVREG